MICDSMKNKAKRNTEKLLSLPIEDKDFFQKIKQLPFFHINREISLDSILNKGRIYSSRHLPKSLKKYHFGNTYPTDVNAGLDSYVFLSFATIADFGRGTQYGDVLMEFDSSIINIPESYFTPKDISCYEALWNKIHYDKNKPINQHRSPYIEQFYELNAIYHYFYHFLKRKKIHTIEQLLEKIFKLKIYPPEIKIYHSLSMDYMNKIHIIPNIHATYYVNKKKYKGRIEIAKTHYNLLGSTHTVLKKIYDPNFVEYVIEDKLEDLRKLIFS